MPDTDRTLNIPSLGQCLACGPRGAFPGPNGTVIVCRRCEGTARDPKRSTDWYWDLCITEQVRRG